MPCDNGTVVASCDGCFCHTSCTSPRPVSLDAARLDNPLLAFSPSTTLAVDIIRFYFDHMLGLYSDCM